MSLPLNLRSAGAASPDGARVAGRRRRRRPLLVAGAVLAVVVLGALAVVAGTRFYAQNLAPQAADPLSLSEREASSALVGEAEPGGDPAGDLDADAAIAPIDVDGAWQVARGSLAGYRLDEVLSGVETTVVGRTLDVSGSVTIEAGMLTAAVVTVLTETIATDEPARDAYFRRAVASEEFPEATFTLGAPVDVSAVGDAEGPVTVSAEGVLAFHGVSAPVTTELQVDRTGDGVEVFATIPITLADHDLEAPDLGFVTVQPVGTIELLLRLVR